MVLDVSNNRVKAKILMSFVFIIDPLEKAGHSRLHL
jgi:hypothetical protein